MWRNRFSCRPLFYVLLSFVVVTAVAARVQHQYSRAITPVSVTSGRTQTPSPLIHDSSGALIQTLISSPGPANTTITIRNVIVGSRNMAQFAPLSGPAVVEWLGGKGTLVIGSGPPQPLSSNMEIVWPARSCS
jgi:hypothetical protein